MHRATPRRERVLVVDDDTAIARLVATYLERSGYEARWASDADSALTLVRQHPFSLLLVDYQLTGQTGLELARVIEQVQRRRVPVVVMTAHGHLDAAIDALRSGASDFLVKPFELKHIVAVVTRVMAHHLTAMELEALRTDLQRADEHHGLLGNDAQMVRLREQLQPMAQVSTSVLITGESGTGKELAARALHQLSPRRDGPWVAINCGALPASLLESELFGHTRGAFTDAREERAGIFREASGGTLFLDEIGELPLSLQAALLRVLQEKKVRPVGANREVSVDVRIVAATNRDLTEAVKQRQFRADLLFRLDVLQLQLPPLRERGEDVLLLARHLMLKACARHQRSITGWSQAFEQALLAHDWPGNVRELENVVERAVLSCSEARLETWHLPSGLGRNATARRATQALLTLEELERRHITHVLSTVQNNKSRAAQVLGIDRVTLHRKLKAMSAPAKGRRRRD